MVNCSFILEQKHECSGNVLFIFFSLTITDKTNIYQDSSFNLGTVDNRNDLKQNVDIKFNMSDMFLE
jgi:hypothetical protein